MKKLKAGLFVRVIIAIVCGALLGLVAPEVLVNNTVGVKNLEGMRSCVLKYSS